MDKYYLMHLNKVVFSFLMNSNYEISEIIEIFHENHIPIGLCQDNVVDIKKINAWWQKRFVPDNRNGFQKMTRYLRIKNFSELVDYNHGLSLSDKYWIKKENETVTWEKINFYTNRFSYDIGNIIFGDRHLKPDDVDYYSPDITTNGCLKKSWRIRDGERYLIKAGSTPYSQEAINEVIASKILKKMNIVPFVKYDLTLINKNPCSVCKNFLNENLEFVSAFTIYKTAPRNPNVSVYDHLIKQCESYKIPNVKEFINNMLIVDYVLLNTDRHLGNFGFLRDANTLEFIGPAPLFDNGTSFWANDHTTHIGSVMKVCRPFDGLWEQQKNIIVGMENVDLSFLSNISSLFEEYLPKSKTIDSDRIQKINTEYKKHLDELHKFQEKQYKKEVTQDNLYAKKTVNKKIIEDMER